MSLPQEKDHPPDEHFRRGCPMSRRPAPELAANSRCRRRFLHRRKSGALFKFDTTHGNCAQFSCKDNRINE